MTDTIADVEYTRPWLYPLQARAMFNPLDSAGKPARMSLIEASTKSGKTVSALAWILEQALGGKPGNNYWWVAPVTGQADIAFTRMRRGLPKGFCSVNLTEKRMILPNGARIWFKGADKPDSLYGEDVYAAVIDEASRVKPGAWHAVRSTLTATRGPLRIIGNVKGRRNWFYELARRAQGGSAGLAYYRITAKDAVEAGVLDAEEIVEAESDLPPQVFKELYLAEASDDGGNPFGLDAIQRCIMPGLSTDEPAYWGWDLGKKQDFTVGIALDIRGHACRFERFQKSWDDTINKIQELSATTTTLVDATGLGDPVLEIIQKGNATSSIQGYVFTSASKQKLMEGLAVAIHRRAVHFPDGQIVNELNEFEYEFTRIGVRYSAPAGYWDDCVCALALAVQAKGAGVDLDMWRKLGQ